MYTIYDNENDSFSKVGDPDPPASNTYADYLRWKFEERPELFRGCIFRLTGPNTSYQQIVRDFTVSASTFLKNKKCEAFAAPMDIDYLQKTVEKIMKYQQLFKQIFA